MIQECWATERMSRTRLVSRRFDEPEFDGSEADCCCRRCSNYRSAHAIALRVGKDAATTEDLRTAMIHYRSLFEELVQVPTAGAIKEVA